MKKLLILFLVTSFLFLNKESKGQWVNIPDANFVSWLTSHYPSAMSGNMMDTTSTAIVNATTVSCFGHSLVNLYGIQYFDNLISLVCYQNQITFLPNLPNSLQTLDCSNNQLSSLSSVLPNGLQTLKCYNNQLTNLPSVLPNGLQTLYCDGNQLTSLPTLPSGLQYLSCSNNQISNLPALPNTLQKLYCGYGNQISSLPALPNSLIELNCLNGILTFLPSLPSNLSILSCENNQLDSLPSLPTALQYLDCFENRLVSLPNLPPTLIHLFCSKNQLDSLPALPNGLLELVCDSNNLAKLPVLPNSLQQLVYSRNPIGNLDSLPSNLQLLGCDSTLTTSLPPLPVSLTQLVCSYTSITSLPPLPPYLYDLYCHHTLISCLPQIDTLDNLDFSNTLVTCIPNYFTVFTSCNPPLNSLPLCGIFSNGCPFYWNIAGKVHLDMDASCTYNATDSSLHNIKVQLWQHGSLMQQVFTNIYGDYSFDVNVFDTFQINVDTTGLPFYLSCPAQQTLTSIISALDSTDINMNFAMLCKSLTDDVSAQNIIAGRHRPGQMVYTTINAGFANSIYGFGCTQANTSGQVKLLKNGPSKFLASAYYSLTPSIITTDSLIWNVSDFNTFPTSIYFNSQVDTTATIGQNICYTLSVIPTIPDANPANNVFQMCYPVMNGWDPNIKSVLPSGNLTATDSVLKYTIQFQNTGNDTAFNIIVRDTLDANLDVKSLKITGYSFEPYTQTFGNIMVFNFPHINLVDSTTNEPKSHGYISYSVKRKPNLPLGTTIKNTAFIYFDLNPAIVTNTTSSSLGTTDIGVSELANNKEQLLIYPNPTKELLVITYPLLRNTIHVYDVLGREVFCHSERSEESKSIALSVGKLAQGIYFIKLTDEKGNVRMGKFVKE